MKNRFLAIDFETANHKTDSACALGLVLVEGKEIVRKDYFLICPPYEEFRFTYIHGIKYDDVRNQPTFGDLWPVIKPYFDEAAFMVAHNISFDRRVLDATALRYNVNIKNIQDLCTVKLSRRIWKIFPTTLPFVCKWLDIELDHHNAMSDATASAKIVINALDAINQTTTLDTYELKLLNQYKTLKITPHEASL